MGKDDPMVLYEDMPRDLLLKMPNCMLVESDYGAHCSFFSVHDSKE